MKCDIRKIRWAIRKKELYNIYNKIMHNFYFKKERKKLTEKKIFRKKNLRVSIKIIVHKICAQF